MIKCKLLHQVVASHTQAAVLSLLSCCAVEDRKTGQMTTKTILKGLSGEVCPGEMVAIIGASGAGKTTLLNLLSGRISGGRVVGCVNVNGEPRQKSFKKLAAFVQVTTIAVAPYMTH